MTQLFSEDGRVTPVTEISVVPSTVLKVKTKETDGYEAVVLGYGERNKIGKALAGFFKNLGKFRYVKEFRTDGNKIDLKQGDKVGLDSFLVGEKVKVSSVSKGKGFQGVVKRHHFAGGPRSHGDKDQMRMGGSVGATAPRRVFKGRKMPGRMGGDMTTISNLEIVKIDLDNNLLYLKGAVAGGSNGLILIKGNGQIKLYETPIIETPVETKIDTPVETVENIEKIDDKIEAKIEKIEEVASEKVEVEEVIKQEEAPVDVEVLTDKNQDPK